MAQTKSPLNSFPDDQKNNHASHSRDELYDHFGNTLPQFFINMAIIMFLFGILYPLFIEDFISIEIEIDEDNICKIENIFDLRSEEEIDGTIPATI